MKRVVFLIVSLICMLAAVSCTEPEPEKVPATKITINSPSEILKMGESLTLEVVVEPENATDKNYQLTVDNPEIATLDGNVLTAVAEGTATVTAALGDLTATAVIKVEKKGEEGEGEGEGEVEEPAKPSVPVTMELRSSFCEIYYWGNFRGETDNITIHLGDDILHNKMYIQGPGQNVIISLQVPHFDDYDNAGVVTGTYEFDDSGLFKPMTIVAQESYYGVYTLDSNGDGYVEATQYAVSDATFTITESGKGYRLEAVLTLNNGEVLWVYYDDEVQFFNQYAEMQPNENNQEQNFMSGYGELTYYGNGEYFILLFEGEDGSVSNRTDRNSLHIYTISETKDNTGLASGQYEVGNQGANWIAEGGWFFDGTMSGVYGSYYYFYKTGKTMADDVHTFGFFRLGTMDVERDGEKYKITVDVVDANGYSIKSTFNGTLKFYDNTRE